MVPCARARQGSFQDLNLEFHGTLIIETDNVGFKERLLSAAADELER